MKLERTVNAKRNIIYGFMLKIYQLLIPFLMRTALVHCLGVEYLGISSLFTSILSVLNLAELGVGSALVFSMYKPIAEDDEDTICALMKLYRLYYRIIGLIILLVGLVITPILPYLVKDNLPKDVNLYVLYFINLGACVLSYWLFAYKNAILSAYQRNDISSKISLLINTILYVFQFVALFYFRDYYLYIMLTLVFQIIANIVTAIVCERMYPNYKPKGELSKKAIKEINGKVKDLFTAKIGGTIINQADTIVISSFLGLTMLAIYNNYYYILSSIIGFATIGYAALTAGIGNSLVTESNEKNYRDFKTILYISMGATCVCTACFLNLFQPFMKIWMGKKLMLDISLVVCLCAYFVIYELNAVLNLFKDAAGIWHQDRFRPLVVSLSNLALNLATVKFLGLYGVMLSTVITMAFIGIPWVTINLFKNIFKEQSIKKLVLKIVLYLTEIVCIGGLTYVICSFLPWGIIGIVLRLVVCVIVSTILYVLGTFKLKEANSALILVKKILKK